MYKGAAATCSLSLVGKILVGTNPAQHSTAQRSTHPAHASLGSRYVYIHPSIPPEKGWLTGLATTTTTTTTMHGTWSAKRKARRLIGDQPFPGHSADFNMGSKWCPNNHVSKIL